MEAPGPAGARHLRHCLFSADKIALEVGFERAGEPRIEAGIKHALSGQSRRGRAVADFDLI